MRFQGFSKQTGEFLWGLMFNNDRTWFNEHKSEYEQYLNVPFKAIAADLTEALNAAYPQMQWQCHISRIYRDARRLFGRGPFKDHLWLALYPAAVGKTGPALWFEVGAARYEYGFGFWDTTPAQMETFRRGIDANPTRFTRLAELVDARDEFSVIGEEYKRPKAERPEPISKWYNRKWVGVDRRCDLEGIAFTPELVTKLVEDYSYFMPMFDYLTELYFGAGDFSGE